MRSPEKLLKSLWGQPRRVTALRPPLHAATLFPHWPEFVTKRKKKEKKRRCQTELPLITKKGEPAWWLRRPEQLQLPHHSDAATLLLETELSASRHCVASATSSSSSSSHSPTCSGAGEGFGASLPSINTKQRLVNKLAKLSLRLSCFACVGSSRRRESYTSCCPPAAIR